ncbi:MAG TPA: DUF599 domain-containing protein [Hyphomicrobiaceae bacterium]|nr:DUF599 domain-containing protein [Hyphomicrobiaceae bacterium]
MPETVALARLPIGGLDFLAAVWFVLAFGGYQLIAGCRALERRSIVGAVQAQRVAWMHNLAIRDNRAVDAILMQGLSQGNAFFASTCAIAIGGLAAIMGSGEQMRAFLRRLPFATSDSTALWEFKTLLLIAIFIYAFFKFAWAFRLSHYAAIMIGAMPVLTDTNRTDCHSHAERAARLIGIAANHTNGGIRSFYYAFAAMAWYFHPVLFMLSTVWILAILIRRDFFSRSLAALAAPG